MSAIATIAISRYQRLASRSRSRRTSPTPSDQPVPAASLEYARQRPSAPRAPPRRLLKEIKDCGVAMVVTPPAIASEDSPARRDVAARWMATSEDEQPVWMHIDGPWRPCRSLGLALSRWVFTKRENSRSNMIYAL